MLHANWFRHCQDNTWAQPSLLSKIPPKGSQTLVTHTSRVPLPFVLPQGTGVPDSQMEILFLCLVPTRASLLPFTHIHSLPWIMDIFQICGRPALNGLPLTRNSPPPVFSIQSLPPTIVPFSALTSHWTPKHTARLWRHELGPTSLMHQLKTLTQGQMIQRRGPPGACTEKAIGYSSSVWFPGHLCII